MYLNLRVPPSKHKLQIAAFTIKSRWPDFFSLFLEDLDPQRMDGHGSSCRLSVLCSTGIRLMRNQSSPALIVQPV